MTFRITLGGLLAILSLLGWSPTGVTSQQTVPVSDLDLAQVEWVECTVASSVPPVRAALRDGAAPLLIVSGRELGRLSVPHESEECSADEPGLVIEEVRFIRPHAARERYGARGRDGAVLVNVLQHRVPPRIVRQRPARAPER